MPSTPIYSLPYPVASNPPDGPAQIQALAVAVEAAIQGAVAAVAAVPTGTIAPYGGAAAPAGWRLCDGSAVSRSTFSALFAIIGTSFGTGDGSSTFNLPNLRGNVLTGLDAGQTEFNARGKTGGSKSHQLSIANLPAHDHGGGSHGHTVNSHSHGGVTQNDSPDHAHTTTGLFNPDAGSGTYSVRSWGAGAQVYHGGGSMLSGGASARHAHGINAESPGTNSVATITSQGDAVNNRTPIMQPFVVTEFMIKT